MPSGLGSPQEQYTYASRWWCTPSEDYWEVDLEKPIVRSSIPKPSFLTAAQSSAAKAEMKKLKEIGDAPIYLADKVLEWARMRPSDKQVPESLFIVYEANDWDKYGCGGNQELRKEAEGVSEVLLKPFDPQSLEAAIARALATRDGSSAE